MSDERRDAQEAAAAAAVEAAAGEAPASEQPSRRAVVTWLWRLPVIAAVGGGAWGIWRAARVHWGKPPADPDPSFARGEPVPVAPLARFDTLWAAEHFVYDGVPAIAMRVPESVPGGLDVDAADREPVHLLGLSRICTHQGCIVDLARDPEAIAVATNYRGDDPSLFCNCHLSVFDPLAAGRAVAGPAQRPLPRVALELRREGDAATVVAVGHERVEARAATDART